MRRRRRSTRTTQGWWTFRFFHIQEHLCHIVLMWTSPLSVQLFKPTPTSGGNDWACPWASVFARWAVLSAWPWLWQWSVWGVYRGAGDFHWGRGTYIRISCCHLRATIGLVLTSPLPCWGLPMRGSWRAILLVEILEKDFHSGFWKDFELKVIRFCWHYSTGRELSMVLSAFQLCNGCAMLTNPTIRSNSCRSFALELCCV